MYTDKKNVLQLAALLKAHGITEVVLCPGSRDIPIVHTLSTHPAFTCYPVTDERSAGFFAIGLALNSGKPVVVCCTSGTALLNLHPAVAEAFYQCVPLVVISADRPAAWIGQMDGQTLPQPGVFRHLVKKAVNLPEVNTEEEEWYCNRLLNEALLEIDHHGQGPVHINIPIAEPLFHFTVPALPEVRVITRHQGWDASLSDRAKKLPKRMVVVGQEHSPRSFGGESFSRLQSYFLWLTEHLGNKTAPTGAIENFDALLYALSEEELSLMAPDLLITYGGHIVSKRLKRFLRTHPPKEHWHISPDGAVADLYCSLTAVVEAWPEEFMEQWAAMLGDDEPPYPMEWKRRSATLPVPSFAYSEMAVVGELMKALPASCVLHLANSSVVRYAQLFSVPPGVTVRCNRGTNGIEGSLSTAVGCAVASDQVNFVVIGDLSFFYDMNALWNVNVRPNLRILLLNNGGGEIFRMLPGLDLSSPSGKFVTATHVTSAKGWAEERGFLYLRATNAEELAVALQAFTCKADTECPLLLEAFTRQEDDARILKEYYQQLMRGS